MLKKPGRHYFKWSQSPSPVREQINTVPPASMEWELCGCSAEHAWPGLIMRNSGYDQIERHFVRQLPCTQDVQGHESPGKVGVPDLRRLERHDNWV